MAYCVSDIVRCCYSDERPSREIEYFITGLVRYYEHTILFCSEFMSDSLDNDVFYRLIS